MNQIKINIEKACKAANIDYIEGDLVEICGKLNKEKEVKNDIYPKCINFFTTDLLEDELGYQSADVKLLFVMKTRLEYNNKQRSQETFPTLYAKIQIFEQFIEFNSLVIAKKLTELQKVNSSLQVNDKPALTFDNLDGILLKFNYKTLKSECDA